MKYCSSKSSVHFIIPKKAKTGQMQTKLEKLEYALLDVRKYMQSVIIMVSLRVFPLSKEHCVTIWSSLGISNIGFVTEDTDAIINPEYKFCSWNFVKLSEI